MDDCNSATTINEHCINANTFKGAVINRCKQSLSFQLKALDLNLSIELSCFEIFAKFEGR